MFWVISVYFNLRNILPKFGTFLLGHPVFVWCAHVHLPDYMNETVESPPLTTYELVLCDVSYGQVFTVGICITKAEEVVSCAEMYAVRGCEC